MIYNILAVIVMVGIFVLVGFAFKDYFKGSHNCGMCFELICPYCKKGERGLIK